MDLATLSKNALASLALGQHMVDSGAHQMTIPIEVDKQHFVIKISKSRSRKFRVVNNPPAPISSGILSNKQEQTKETNETTIIKNKSNETIQ